MARRPLIITRTRPYHITNRSNNREWFYVPLEDAWKIFASVLSRCADIYKTEIRSFVLMSNHYHLMAVTPLGNLSATVRYLQTETCRAIQRKCSRINHIFGGRYKWSALLTDSAVAYAYKYLSRNPVASGVSTRVEDYRYGSAYYLNRGIEPPFPIVEEINPRCELIPQDWQSRLE